MSSRPRHMLIAAAIVLTLIAGSPLRVVGDGGEYLAQALNFARLEGPSIGRQALPEIEQQVKALAPTLAEWDMASVMARGADSRRDFLHFWFYALLSTPALALALSIGAPPLVAFTLTNLAFFGVALWVALPRLGAAASVLLFAGPIIWWLDKPHTEVFSFALLVIALLLQREQPWWALVAAGMAATQNPPMTGLFVLLGALALVRQRGLVRDRRFLAGAAAGLALAALHPAYTLVRYGTPSLLLRATTPGVPTAAEVWAVVLDPTLGLIGNYPIFLVVAGFALAASSRRGWRAIATPELAVAAIAAAVFLYSFARTVNFHHGATPSLSRYALWLVPLVVPLLVALAAEGPRWWRPFVTGSAALSAVACVFAFHPGVRQNSREPTWAATWLWTSHPGWQNPLPEVFSETLLHREGLLAPVATSGCEKMLLADLGNGEEPRWPFPCYPVDVGRECLEPGAICYVNQRDAGYATVAAPGRVHGAIAANPDSWTTAEAAEVRHLFDRWGWGGAPPRPADLSHLRQNVDVSVMTLGAPEQFLLILGGFGAAPALRFRFDQPMEGRLIDPASDAVLTTLAAPGDAEEVWTLDLPSTYSRLVLTMNAASSTQ